MFEPFKAIVLDKWKGIPELDDFVAYVVPQWFVGMFSNWQIFRSPPGFANTNNPLESFNKIIKAQFTNYDEQPILTFIAIVIKLLIPYFSINEKEFMFYRVPHKLTKKFAKNLVPEKFNMKSVVECTYVGLTHTHTINFRFKSCTCRWFMAFTACAHLVAACDLFEQFLDGHTKKKTFVYRSRKGRKKAELTFSQKAFSSNPMPIIATPDMLPVEDDRQSLFLIDTNNMPTHPTINRPEEAVHFVAPTEEEAPQRVKRTYVKRTTTTTTTVPTTARKSKRLQSAAIPVPSTSVELPKKKRGRPCKITPALSVE